MLLGFGSDAPAVHVHGAAAFAHFVEHALHHLVAGALHAEGVVTVHEGFTLGVDEHGPHAGEGVEPGGVEAAGHHGHAQEFDVGEFRARAQAHGFAVAGVGGAHPCVEAHAGRVAVEAVGAARGDDDRPGADDMEIARADIEARRAADGTAVGEQIGGDHAVEHGAPGLAGGLGEERLHPLAVEVDPPRAGLPVGLGAVIGAVGLAEGAVDFFETLERVGEFLTVHGIHDVDVGHAPGAFAGEFEVGFAGVPFRAGVHIGEEMVDAARDVSAALNDGLVHDDDGSALLPGGEGRVEAAHAAADDQYVRLMTMGLHRNGSLFSRGCSGRRGYGARPRRSFPCWWRRKCGYGLRRTGRSRRRARRPQVAPQGGACRTSPSRGLCRGGR